MKPPSRKAVAAAVAAGAAAPVAAPAAAVDKRDKKEKGAVASEATVKRPKKSKREASSTRKRPSSPRSGGDKGVGGNGVTVDGSGGGGGDEGGDGEGGGGSLLLPGVRGRQPEANEVSQGGVSGGVPTCRTQRLRGIRASDLQPDGSLRDVPTSKSHLSHNRRPNIRSSKVCKSSNSWKRAANGQKFHGHKPGSNSTPVSIRSHSRTGIVRQLAQCSVITPHNLLTDMRGAAARKGADDLGVPDEFKVGSGGSTSSLSYPVNDGS